MAGQQQYSPSSRLCSQYNGSWWNGHWHTGCIKSCICMRWCHDLTRLLIINKYSFDLLYFPRTFSRYTCLIWVICIMWLMECSRLLTKMYFNFDVKFRSPQQLLSVIWSDLMYGCVCFDAARIHVYNQGEFDGVSPRTRPLPSNRVSVLFYSLSWGSSLTESEFHQVQLMCWWELRRA